MHKASGSGAELEPRALGIKRAVTALFFVTSLPNKRLNTQREKEVMD